MMIIKKNNKCLVFSSRKNQGILHRCVNVICYIHSLCNAKGIVLSIREGSGNKDIYVWSNS